MNSIRNNLPALPATMSHLQIDERGYPVPWFVKWYDGKPDFRIVDSEKFIRAVRDELCFVCGGKLGKFRAFVGGPMAILQMVSAEPPTHHSCAEFAVKACPFLLLPRSKRRRSNMPEDTHSNVGETEDVFVEENPGISGVWTCVRYRVSPSGRTFHFADCARLQFFTEGREATQIEIENALHSARDRIEQIHKLESP